MLSRAPAGIEWGDGGVGEEGGDERGGYARLGRWPCLSWVGGGVWPHTGCIFVIPAHQLHVQLLSLTLYSHHLTTPRIIP